MQFLPAIILLLAPISLALPVSDVENLFENSIEARQTATRCGTTSYTAAQVTAARTAGYNYHRAGKVAPKSNYPHLYKNFEKFKFLVVGPYYEYPLLAGGLYTGGGPGADRVIFNGTGHRAGEITHTGAPAKNAFVKCAGW